MIFALNTFWQVFISFIVWIPLTLRLVSALELAAASGANPNEAG